MKRFLIVAAALALTACSPQAGAPSGAELRSVSIAAGQKVTSPLMVTGVAPSNWYFEAVFQARIVDANGVTIAEAPAQAQSDWMVDGPVPFAATLPFAVSGDTPATLVLEEDMPGEDKPPREMRIPIVLTASPS